MTYAVRASTLLCLSVLSLLVSKIAYADDDMAHRLKILLEKWRHASPSAGSGRQRLERPNPLSITLSCEGGPTYWPDFISYYQDDDDDKKSIDLRTDPSDIIVPIGGSTAVYGWLIRGGRGGCLKEYTVYSLSHNGDWVHVYNPQSGGLIFYTAASEDVAVIETIVQLPNPIVTSKLKIHSLSWIGMHRLQININSCVIQERDASDVNVIDDALAAELLHGVVPEQVWAQVLVHSQPAEEPDIRSTRPSRDEEYSSAHVPNQLYSPAMSLLKEGHNTCVSKSRWKYGSPTPDPDDFTARYHSAEAWKAKEGLVNPDGYVFPRFLNMFNNKFYIQIDFQENTKIKALRIHGNRDGEVKLYFLSYKPYQGGNWSHIPNTEHTIQMFDVKHKDGNSLNALTSILPVPISASSIRLYPQKWQDKPILYIDIYGCHIAQYESPCQDGGVRSLIARSPSPSYNGRKVTFDGLPANMKHRNLDTYAEVQFHRTHLVTVHSFIFTTRSSQEPEGLSKDVLALKISYMDSTGRWHFVKTEDKNGKYIPKIYLLIPAERDSGKERTYTFVAEYPLHTNVIRIYPEDWDADKPQLTLDILGC